MKGLATPLAELRVDQLRQWQILATNALNRVANSRIPTSDTFQVRQKVWLEARNLALPYGSVKLAPRHYGPFKITQAISPVAYKLVLPY